MSSTKIKFNTPTKENIMTFSKFDTQIQIEEVAYEPTAEDLAELAAWNDELDSELDDYDVMIQELEDEDAWHEEVNYGFPPLSYPN